MHLLTPDMPVKEFSPLLESCYEQLHRKICQQFEIPESISSIALFCNSSKTLFYEMRTLLEDDFGISEFVSATLLTPDLGGKLSELYKWETTEIGIQEYESRLSEGYDSPYSSARDCWMQYRITLFETTRIIRITNLRITGNAPVKQHYRFPWINDSNVTFESR